MKKKHLTLLLSLITFSIISQDLYKDFNLYYAPFKKQNEVDLVHLQKFGFQDIYTYNSNDFITYKDSIEIFNNIKYVVIKFEENLNLDSIINNLKLIPKLKYIKFKNSFFLKKSISNNQFPTKLKNIINIETIVFDGIFDWDWNIVFTELSLLPNLKNVAFISNSKDILLKPNLLKLKKIEGLYFSSRMGPTLPEKIYTLPKLKTIVIYCDEYNDLNKLFTKLHSIPKLKNLLFYGGIFNDSISKSFEKFDSLNKVCFLSTQFKNPELFFKFLSKNNKITEIKISNNKLDTIPQNIELLDSLKIFYSSNNIKTTTLPSAFYNLKKLESIEIQGSNLERIDTQINSLKNLKTLNIYYNKIDYLPTTISGLEELEILNIKHNMVNTLPNDIGLLKNLRELSIANNQLNTLPENIYLLQNLEILNLENNYLKLLPQKFGRLKNLKILNLQNNQLKQIPNSFSNLQNLKSLDLQVNDISYLPKNFGKLKSLERLDINSNFIAQLPKSFGELSNLKTLNLSNNNLKLLPSGFGQLSKLENLYLNNRENNNSNFIKYDHISGGFIKDTTMRLARKKNEISTLSNDFENLHNLKWVDLSHNTQLNSEYLFEKLKKSTFSNYNLSLSNCNISNLPKKNWNKISVNTLDISNNNIAKIPQDIKNAPYLSSLNLSKNNKYNTSRNTREQINLLLEEEGILNIDELPKTTKMAIAFAEVSNKKYYSKEYDKSIYYANKAIEIDSVIAFNKLFDDHYIESLYRTKKYKKAIYYANSAIKKDTSARVRFLNSILPNFSFKAKSQLAINDTLGAIKTLAIVSEDFHSNNWSEAGLLAKKIGLDSLANNYFEHSFSFYTQYLEQKPKDLSYQLSFLEAYIVAGEIDKAKEMYLLLLKTNIQEASYKTLLDFFRVVILIIEDSPEVENEIQKFKVTHNKVDKVRNWSFQLLIDWNTLNKLSINQKEKIEDITIFANVKNQ